MSASPTLSVRPSRMTLSDACRKRCRVRTRKRVARERAVLLPRAQVDGLVAEEDVVRTSVGREPGGGSVARGGLSGRVAVEQLRRLPLGPTRLSDDEGRNGGAGRDGRQRRSEPSEGDQRRGE